MKKLLFVLLTIVLSGQIFIPSPARSDVPFPTKPVTIWVGLPAGGGTDIIIRTLAEGAEKSLGQRIIVMNKPGGVGTVAASLLTKERPDGYTLAAFPDTPITRAPHLRDLSYDPLQDLSFIIRVGKWKNVFAVKADSPFKKWEEMVDWAKKNPGQLIHGHAGVGGAHHVAMAKVGTKEGFTYKDVPFGGEAPAISALLGGHVTIAGAGSVAIRSHVEAKTVRLLLVMDKEGLDYAPDVPTFEKVGYDFEAPMFVVICTPKGIPDPIRERLEKVFLDGMKAETFMTLAKTQQFSVGEPLTGKGLLDYMRKWNALYEQYIKEAGIYKMEKK